MIIGKLKGTILCDQIFKIMCVSYVMPKNIYVCSICWVGCPL